MKQKRIHSAIAACAITVTPGNEIQLFPAGEFRSIDGRPKDAPHWFIDSVLAAAIIADFESRQNLTVVDYEHQTLLTAQNGQPAPAAAWFGKLEWRSTGLYATDVDWTERATSMIESGEYKYISPVFSYDKKTGAVKRLINAALTNNPALDGMDAVAASQFNLKEYESMSKLGDYLSRVMKEKGVTAAQMGAAASIEEGTVQQILNGSIAVPPERRLQGFAQVLGVSLDEIKAQLPEGASMPDALSRLLAVEDESNEQQIAAAASALQSRLSQTEPDPAQYVPISAMQAVQTELATLTAQVRDQEVDGLVTVALTDGKLLPAQEKWARDLGGKDIAALTAYLETAQPTAALTAQQTGGKKPEGGGSLDVNDANAISHAALTYQSEQAAAGITITSAQAVAHVTKGA